MKNNKLLTFLTAVALGLTSVSFMQPSSVSTVSAETTVTAGEERITDHAKIREMFTKFIEENGLQVTCVEEGKYSDFSDKVILEFEAGTEDYITVMRYADANNIDSKSFTYMVCQNGIPLTTTLPRPVVTTTTAKPVVNTTLTTAKPIVTDAQGRIVDENGNVLIVNGTSAVVSVPVTTTTATSENTEYFSLMWKDYYVAEGDTTYIAYCGSARPESWTVSEEGIISLDNSGLKVTGLKPGKVTITYKDRDTTVNAYVLVTAKDAVTTTAVRDNYTTTSTTVTATATQTVTSTVIYCFAPTVEFDKSDMTVGETREGRFYNPETKKTENGSVYASNDNISVEYTAGSDTFRVTALKPGPARLSFSAAGCAFAGYADWNIVSGGTNITPETTVTGTTTVVTTSTVHYDYMTKAEFDNSPMNVGETREISFRHPSENTTGGSVITSSDIVSIDYEKGSNTFRITALKEGTATVMAYATGCTFGAPISVKIVSNKKTRGDANCDEGLDMADAVYIMQSIANPDKYKLSAVGKLNADMDGDGVTAKDAQSIQKKLLGISDEKITDLSTIHSMLSAFIQENKLAAAMTASVPENDKYIIVNLATFDYDEQNKIKEQTSEFLKSVNIDEELVKFAVPQMIID